MKHSIIDIGSNSMRLTVYEIEHADFKTLFKEKQMAGLAGYVVDGCLSDEGITRAIDGLLVFKNTLGLLGLLDQVSVFATASLRNIDNTSEALEAIETATGFTIEVISGEDETRFGYSGALHELDMDSGVFMDIGGASTELAIFENHELLFTKSYPIGSLKLYRSCVKKILPGPSSIQRLNETITGVLDEHDFAAFEPQAHLVGVGGTARSVLKIARKVCKLPADANELDRAQLQQVADALFSSQREAADLILKSDPDHIHTLMPGFLVMMHIIERFRVESITISKYGAREGYLAQCVIGQQR